MEPEVIHLETLRPASVAGRNFSVHQALAPVGNSVGTSTELVPTVLPGHLTGDDELAM